MKNILLCKNFVCHFDILSVEFCCFIPWGWHKEDQNVHFMRDWGIHTIFDLFKLYLSSWLHNKTQINLDIYMVLMTHSLLCYTLSLTVNLSWFSVDALKWIFDVMDTCTIFYPKGAMGPLTFDFAKWPIVKALVGNIFNVTKIKKILMNGILEESCF